MDTQQLILPHSKVKELLEQQPFAVELWARLAHYTCTQNDTLSTESIATIIVGLTQLRNERGNWVPSSTATALFIRLAKSYNDPLLLKQAGKLFLNEWSLPGAAVAFFERALFLGGAA